MNLGMTNSEKEEKEALLQAAKFMLIAARTAPKTGGVDDILTSIVQGRQKDLIANKMDEIGEERKIEGFKRDAGNVRDSEAVFLVGVSGRKSAGFDCGGRGIVVARNSIKRMEDLVKTSRVQCVFSKH